MLKRIDKESVHRICSGQVVLSLAIAVKELVENSIDAGATNIEVKLKDFGSELIEVSDNGCGVHPDNYQNLTLKHYTSKISQFSDIVTVSTFGFRGEALSSLCALGNLSIITCHDSQVVGCHLYYDHNGLIKKQSNCAREIGTTVSISNLFCTLPVRQKEFHRNLKKEYGKLIQMLQGYCLIASQVKICCYNQTGKIKRQLVLTNSGRSQIIDNVSCVFGPKQAETIVPIVQYFPTNSQEEKETFDEEIYNNFKLSGYISKCIHGCGRSSTDRQFFFVNGRPCDHSKLSKTINEVYHMFNKQQYPFIILNIDTAQKELVDVNVTPDKRQLMLQQEKALLQLTKMSLIKLFEPMQTQITAPTPPLTPVTPFATKPSTINSSLISPSMTKTSSNNSLTSPSIPTFFTKHSTNMPTTSFSPSLSSDSLNSSSPTPLSSSTSLSFSVPLTSSSLTPLSSSTSLSSSTLLTSSSPTSLSSSFPVATTTCTGISSTTTISSSIPSHTSISGIKRSANGDQTTDGQPKLKQPCLTDFGIVNKTVSLQSKPQQTLSPIIINKHCTTTPKHTAKSTISTTPLYETPPLSFPSMEEPPIIFDTDCPVVKDDCTSKYCIKLDIDKMAARLEAKEKCPLLSADHQGNKRRYFHAKIQPESNHDAEDELKRELSKEDFKQMEILGQFNKGFIIAKLGNDIFIIDQHATDEKYNFEKLQRETIIEHQSLIHPLPLELTVIGESIISDNLEIFEKNGFRFTINNEAPPTKRVSLIGQPVSKNWSMGVPEIEELIFLLTDFPGEMVRPACVTKMLASRSCRSSIMIGTVLSIKDMYKLVSHMSDMDQPWNCPHGRPTIRHLVDLSKLAE